MGWVCSSWREVGINLMIVWNWWCLISFKRVRRCFCWGLNWIRNLDLICSTNCGPPSGNIITRSVTTLIVRSKVTNNWESRQMSNFLNWYNCNRGNSRRRNSWQASCQLFCIRNRPSWKNLGRNFNIYLSTSPNNHLKTNNLCLSWAVSSSSPRNSHTTHEDSPNDTMSLMILWV